MSADADISVRYAPPTTDLDLVARRGPTLHFKLFGTQAYIAQHGLPVCVLQLGEHFFIEHTVQRHLPSLDTWHAILASLPVKLRVGSYISVLAGLNEGQGLSLQPVYATTMAPHLIAADLDLGFKSESWVIYQAHRRGVARVRAVAEEIVAMGIRDQKSFFGG
jgi:hypothetical protein